MRIVLFVLVALTAAQAVGQEPMKEGEPPVGGGSTSETAKLPTPAPATSAPEIVYRHVGEVSHVHRWHPGGRRNGNGGRRVRGGISMISLKQFENVERTVLREEFPKAYLKGEQLAVSDPVVFEGRARIVASGGLLYDAASAAGHKGLLPPMGKSLPFAFGAAARPTTQPGATQPPAAPSGPQATAPAPTPSAPARAPAAGSLPTWLKAVVWILAILAVLLLIGRLARGGGRAAPPVRRPLVPPAGGAAGAPGAPGSGRAGP